MHKSVDHILTSHTGSLPRGAELNDLLIADEAGEKVDQAKLVEKIDKRVAYVMEKQRWAGVDIANDGEQGRVGFQTYVPKRMHGFGGELSGRSARNGSKTRSTPKSSRRAFPRPAKCSAVPSASASSNITTRKPSRPNWHASRRPRRPSARRSRKCSSPSHRRASSPPLCLTPITRRMRPISTPSPARCTTNTGPWSTPV